MGSVWVSFHSSSLPPSKFKHFSGMPALLKISKYNMTQSWIQVCLELGDVLKVWWHISLKRLHLHKTSLSSTHWLIHWFILWFSHPLYLKQVKELFKKQTNLYVKIHNYKWYAQFNQITLCITAKLWADNLCAFWIYCSSIYVDRQLTGPWPPFSSFFIFCIIFLIGWTFKKRTFPTWCESGSAI